MLLNIILVGIGGGIGASLRALLTDLIKKIWNHSFPLATFIINITGSFLLGVILHYHSNDLWKLLLGTGVMGGYTTFSTYHYEAVSLLKAHKKLTFLLYYSLSVICGLIAAILGLMI